MNVSNPLRHSHHRLKAPCNNPSASTATTASFDQFIRNLSLEKRQNNAQIQPAQPSAAPSTSITESDVYNIPWDFKNKLAPPSQDEHYCAPWDLKLQEEKLKNLSSTSTGSNEYQAPWEDPTQPIVLKQIHLNKSSTSIASSASSRTCSPTPTPVSSTLIKTTPPGQQYLKPSEVPLPVPVPVAVKSCACEIASANHLLQPLCANHHHLRPHLVTGDKFCSWGSNCSSNCSSDDTRPLIRSRKTSSQRVVRDESLKTASSGAPPPLPSQPAYMAALQRQSWFHGKITRKVAEDLLEGKSIGSYLVRQSESGDTNDFSLSLVSGSGCVHMRICMKTNEFILGQCSQPFSSIVKMIEHYAKVEVPIKGAQHVKLTNALARE